MFHLTCRDTPRFAPYPTGKHRKQPSLKKHAFINTSQGFSITVQHELLDRKVTTPFIILHTNSGLQSKGNQHSSFDNAGCVKQKGCLKKAPKALSVVTVIASLLRNRSESEQQFCGDHTGPTDVAPLPSPPEHSSATCVKSCFCPQARAVGDISHYYLSSRVFKHDVSLLLKKKKLFWGVVKKNTSVTSSSSSFLK